MKQFSFSGREWTSLPALIKFATLKDADRVASFEDAEVQAVRNAPASGRGPKKVNPLGKPSHKRKASASGSVPSFRGGTKAGRPAAAGLSPFGTTWEGTKIRESRRTCNMFKLTMRWIHTTNFNWGFQFQQIGLSHKDLLCS